MLQYDFEHKKINRDDLSQNDQFSDKDKDNFSKNVKKPWINNNQTFKLKWLIEFSWLYYDENKKRMYCTLCI